eukprot:PhM_4_TR4439/c0_g1_i1/m.33159
MATVKQAEEMIAGMSRLLDDSGAADLLSKVTLTFDNLDKDKSGYLDVDEGTALIDDLFAMMHYPPPPAEQSKECFNGLDADKSGSLTKDEVAEGIKHALRIKIGYLQNMLAYAKEKNLGPDDVIQ